MLSGTKLREIWARYGTGGTPVDNTFPQQFTAPFYLFREEEPPKIQTLIAEFATELQAIDACWEARARDIVREIGTELDGPSLDVIMEVIGEGESFRQYNNGKSTMRNWFLRKLGVTP